MIFPPDIARKIGRGEKTMIRRPVAGPLTDEFGLCRVKIGRRYPVEYAVASRTSEFDRSTRETVHIAWMVVTDVRRERLGEITADDAQAEGFARRGFGQAEEFLADWRERHRGELDRDQEVWVIAFDVEPEMPMYVATGVIGPPHGDYTTNPHRAIDDAEAVDAATLSRYSKEAADSAAQRAQINQLRRERYELEQRLARARADAARGGVDISSPLRVIERQLATIERRVYEGKAA